MNKLQSATFSMIRSVETFCDDNTDIIDTVPAFVDVVGLLKAMIGGFKGSAKKGARVITGITSEKNGEKDALADDAAVVAALLYSYAASQQLTELKAETDLAPSTLKDMPDNEMVLACESIITLATQYKPAMANYGLTQAKIDALELSCQAFSNAVPQPRNAISVRKKGNENVAASLKEMSTLLHEQMDRLVLSLKKDHPDFAAEYASCRKTINTAIRHKKVSPQAVAAVAPPVVVAEVVPETEPQTVPLADTEPNTGLIAV